MTGDDLILEALLLHGIIYAGQTISPEAHATSVLGLNLMLGEWNAQGMAIFSIARKTYLLVAGKADYTIGSPVGGTFADLDTPRPEKIDSWATHSALSGSDAGVPVTGAEFGSGRAALEREAWELGLLSGPNLQGNRIKLLNYDSAYPTGIVHLYPAPAFNMTLDLWVWEQLTAIADTTLAVDFAPGYLKALTYNLSVDLAPKFGREVSPSVKTIADACKAGLASTNVSQHSLPKAPPAAAAQ
jgi:hypothetical protein